jgi:hypothetical protein
VVGGPSFEGNEGGLIYKRLCETVGERGDGPG